jgi:hypothetical protein
MAVKVTGLFQSPQSNLIYESPILGLVPHLEYPGVLNLEVRMFPSGSSMPNGGMYYANIDQTQLSYPTENNPYGSLIYALETYVITNLSGSSAINSQSTFERYVPTAQNNFL